MRKSVRRIDEQIDEIFKRRCSGVQINILDIPKVFRAGRLAHDAGQDVEAAVVAEVSALRVS